MATKKLKAYRLSEDTLNKLSDLQKASGKDATKIIETTIRYAHGELLKMQLGKEYDQVLVSQVIK